MLNKNEFGELVKSYRKQRGLTQEEVAEKWGHSRGYVTQIERGQRKLDSTTQLIKLADLLEIPTEKLEAIGRGIPERKKDTASKGDGSDVLQMLLNQSKDMVRFAWIAWYADSAPYIEEKLHNLTSELDHALAIYQGEFVKPAQQLLAYAHQMQGKIAFDRLDYASASAHFSEMIDLGEELNNPDIIALGMVHQGDLLRKRGRYETALRRFEAAKLYADASDPGIQGVRYTFMARAHYLYGKEDDFKRAIDPALEIASNMKDTLENRSLQFSLDEALQFQAAGYTMFWKPEKAIEIYKETDRLRPFRPLREQGSYNIEKAQAYLHLEDLDNGVAFSLKGIGQASSYHSRRHILRLEAAYNRLRARPIGRDTRLITLHDALEDARRKQAEW